MLDYATVFIVLLEVVLLFNLLILVHELGHFVVARYLGLVVDRFGIWFGRPLWKKRVDAVEFSVGWIPAGGFVSLPQMSPMESVEGKPLEQAAPIPPASPSAKIAVALAGPAASMTLALLLGCIVWFVGRPVSESETTTVVGFVVPDGPAAQAGILPGDKILKVNGQVVEKFTGMGQLHKSVLWNIISSEETKIHIEAERAGRLVSFEVTPSIPPREGLSRRPLPRIGMLPSLTAVVAGIQEGSLAARSGLRLGDRISAIDSVPVTHPQQLAYEIQQRGSGEMELEVVSPNGENRVIAMTAPELHLGATTETGITWDDRGTTVLSYPNPFQLVGDSVDTIIATLGAVLSPRGEVSAEHLSGPVGIMRIYYLLFESPDGWRLALWFSVVLNVNLALINLLPLPVLDGGHVALGCVEAVRRRPFAPRFLAAIQNASAMIIIGYMLYVTFFDLQDLPWFSGSP